MLAAYDLGTLLELEKKNETAKDYGIEGNECNEKSLVLLHNQTKFHFPSYLLRFHTFNDTEIHDEKTLCVVMESGSEKAFLELKERYANNLYKAPDEFLVIAAQKENGMELRVLTEFHEPIINKIINRVDRKYWFRGLEKDDLLQEAFIGFLKAIEVFKVERRTKFRDFSRYVIERHLGTLMYRSKNLRNKALNESFSFNMPVNTNNETTFEDLLEGTPYIPENIFLNVEMCKEIVSKLTENELEVLYPYSEGYSYEEIAFIIMEKRGTVDFAGFNYEEIMAEIKKNDIYLSTKQITYQAIADRLVEKKSPLTGNFTYENLLNDIKNNLEFENADGLTFKMIADEIKRRRKSVDNTIQRIRNKGFEHRDESLKDSILAYDKN